MTTNGDRRKVNRLKIECSVWICPTDDASGVFCETKDISAGGFSSVITEPLAVTPTINCLFYLPSPGARLYAKATIVWRKVLENGNVMIGAQFLYFQFVNPRDKHFPLRAPALASGTHKDEGHSQPASEWIANLIDQAKNSKVN